MHELHSLQDPLQFGSSTLSRSVSVGVSSLSAMNAINFDGSKQNITKARRVEQTSRRKELFGFGFSTKKVSRGRSKKGNVVREAEEQRERERDIVVGNGELADLPKGQKIM